MNRGGCAAHIHFILTGIAMSRILSRSRFMLVLPLAFALAACESTAPDALVSETSLNASSQGGAHGSVASQLAAVRALTAPFHDADAGIAAGWFAELSPCVEVPGLGGMGFHYGNPGYIENGQWDAMQPEVLLYEPQRNGRLRLVGVEYIVPFVFHGPDEPAPMLFGQEFHPNTTLGLWALHVWLWRNNPAGMFADFNPKVSCAHAPPPAP
jgi:hypothetical protein